MMDIRALWELKRRALESEMIFVKRLNTWKRVTNNTCILLSSELIALALHSLYIEKDYKKFREHMYKAWKVAAMNISKDVTTQWKRLFSIRRLMPIILSDDEKLLDRLINNIAVEDMDHHLSISWIMKFWEWFLKEDNDKMILASEWLATCLKKSWEKYEVWYLHIINGVIEEDKEKIQEWIEQIAKTHEKRELYNWLPLEIMAIDMCGLLKILRRRWIEIEVDHPTIPMEIIPIQPLEEYPQYEFLDEWDREKSV